MEPMVMPLFFVQAEDDIRDRTVTGVQTCALPIFGDTYESWTNNTDLTSFVRRFPLIIVMPDGGKGSNAGWYSDWKDGSRQWETFHIEVLIPYEIGRASCREGV